MSTYYLDFLNAPTTQLAPWTAHIHCSGLFWAHEQDIVHQAGKIRTILQGVFFLISARLLWIYCKLEVPFYS